MSKNERQCVLSMYEMSLKKDFAYSEKIALFKGFEGLSEYLERTVITDNQALVFMLRGLHDN